jgi:hypothetical protein
MKASSFQDIQLAFEDFQEVILIIDSVLLRYNDDRNA